MDETRIEKFCGCSNPQVKDRTLFCDGNCSICGYRYTIDTNEVINNMSKYELNIDLAEGKDVSVENTFIGGKLIDSKIL